MAAAPPQIDPAAELAALRVRAAALGASADTPDACLPEFETFSGKVLPLFEKNACGIVVKNVGTMKASYAGYFQAIWDTAAGVVRLQCLVGGGCKVKPVSYHVKGKAGEHTFPFTNASNHLLACPGRPFLLAEHLVKRNVVKEKESEAQIDPKRPRSLDEPLEHLSAIGVTVESYRKDLLRSLVMDCRPLSTVDNFGFRYLQRVLKLPTFSRRSINRLFDAEYASLVTRPIEAQLQLWNEKQVLVFGGERFEFQNDLTAGFDGWGVGCFTFRVRGGEGPVFERPIHTVRQSGSMVQQLTAQPLQLRSRYLPIALYYWKVGEHGAAGG